MYCFVQPVAGGHSCKLDKSLIILGRYCQTSSSALPLHTPRAQVLNSLCQVFGLPVLVLVLVCSFPVPKLITRFSCQPFRQIGEPNASARLNFFCSSSLSFLAFLFFWQLCRAGTKNSARVLCQQQAGGRFWAKKNFWACLKWQRRRTRPTFFFFSIFFYCLAYFLFFLD